MKTSKYSNRIVNLGLKSTLVSLLFVAGACSEEFLNVEPQGKQEGAVFWKNEEDATKAVNAMYANLRAWNNTAFAAIAIESLGSDETEKGSSVNDASYLNDFDNFSATSGQGQINDFWKGQYQNINYANQVLDNIPAITMDENLKARYLAEAKFVRAYSHFRLVRAFGDVPIRLRVPVGASEYNVPRDPKATVYAAIEKDLTDAIAVLPDSYGSADLGRITKGAAQSLFAKVAMYQGNWAKVLEMTNAVIASGKYSLFADYEKLFRVANENSVESIFEIQCSLVVGNTGVSNSQYSQVQGVRGVTGGGWGFNVPTAALAAAYETGDPRRDATIIFRGETTPQGDVIAAIGDNPMYNQKSYVPFSMFVSGYNEGAQQNIRVIRFADVLLMHAEAANEQGQTADALASLEKVRARARGASTTILPRVTTTDKTALRTAIWHERQVELAMEFDRYFDVIRQGRGTTVFGPKGWKAGKNEVWPIPQAEIELSAGLLTQNPGY